MSTMQMQSPEREAIPRRSVITRVKKQGRGVVVAGALAAIALTAAPMTAQAHGPGTGAAIGLGILGAVIAGTAIAAATQPVYAAPPSYYYYPQQGYYYNNAPAPGYYNAPPSYYGSAQYSYPPGYYQ